MIWEGWNGVELEERGMETAGFKYSVYLTIYISLIFVYFLFSLLHLL